MKLENQRSHIQKQPAFLITQTTVHVHSFQRLLKMPVQVQIKLIKAVKIYPFIKSFKVLGLYSSRRSQWPRLRRRSAAARPMRLWVRIPPGAWMFVCCERCVLSGTGLRDELSTRPE